MHALKRGARLSRTSRVATNLLSHQSLVDISRRPCVLELLAGTSDFQQLRDRWGHAPRPPRDAMAEQGAPFATAASFEAPLPEPGVALLPPDHLGLGRDLAEEQPFTAGAWVSGGRAVR